METTDNIFRKNDYNTIVITSGIKKIRTRAKLDPFQVTLRLIEVTDDDESRTAVYISQRYNGHSSLFNKRISLAASGDIKMQ